MKRAALENERARAARRRGSSLQAATSAGRISPEVIHALNKRERRRERERGNMRET